MVEDLVRLFQLWVAADPMTARPEVENQARHRDQLHLRAEAQEAARRAQDKVRLWQWLRQFLDLKAEAAETELKATRTKAQNPDVRRFQHKEMSTLVLTWRTCKGVSNAPGSHLKETKVNGS